MNKVNSKLLCDLLARLPYDPIVKIGENPNPFRLNHRLKWLLSYGDIKCIEDLFVNIKPYLRKLTSITEEEKNDLEDYINMRYVEKWCEGKESLFVGNLNVRKINQIYDWCNMHHFDYRGLIENGLAIEVTPENNPYK